MATTNGEDLGLFPQPSGDIHQRLTRLETEQKYLATREDIKEILLTLEKQRGDLTTTLEKQQNVIVKWVVVTGLSTIGLGFAALVASLSYLRWLESLAK